MCKNSLYRTNRHSCYLLEYHLVVVTKYRHPVLKGAIKVYLLDQTKTIFDSWHCTIKAVNTDLDHIHILFEAPPQVQLSKLANNYKTVTLNVRITNHRAIKAYQNIGFKKTNQYYKNNGIEVISMTYEL